MAPGMDVLAAPALSRSSDPESTFDVSVDESNGRRTLRLGGAWLFSASTTLWRALRHHARDAGPSTPLDIDVSNTSRIDAGVLALIVQLQNDLAQRGVDSKLLGTSERTDKLVSLYRRGQRRAAKAHEQATEDSPRNSIEVIGAATYEGVREGQSMLATIGETVVALGKAIARPRLSMWRDFFPTIERSGPEALPIVLLTNFLVGFIMAYQSAAQLRLFGANLYVADLVGLGMTRELAPLMTAIVVCGRTGAAFAAELGTMKVNEEMDALRTMGLDPIAFLVLPRVLGLVCVVPVLALLADAVGILGGLFVATQSLDLSSFAYMHEIQESVFAWDVISGLIKSAASGAAIAIICSAQGLAASGGAESVGRRTTKAVVTTLFALIVIDAAFTVVFRAFDQ